MQAPIYLQLFGNPQIKQTNGSTVFIRSAKGVALLAYLLLQKNRSQQRSVLATLLWEEQNETTARKNLTQTVKRLRADLADSNGSVLEASRHSIGLSQTAPLICDVVEFEAKLAKSKTHQHQSLAICQSCQRALAEAIELVSGRLLAGLELRKGARQFEEWLMLKREALHEQQLYVLAALADGAATRADYAAMADYARQQLVLESWREKAHRQLIEALAHDGKQGEALAQAERCRQVLADELGVEPAAETIALIEAVKSKTLKKAAVPTRRLLDNLPLPTTPFVGRRQEIGEIAQRVLSGGYRLVTLIGLGGSGKTRLGLEVARTLLTRDCGLDGIFFVELGGIDSAENIPQAIAQALNLGLKPNRPVVEQVLDRLQQQSALLLLDNFEHLLDDELAVDFVVRLLKDAPTVRLLVTSRRALDLLAEDLIELQGLALTVDGVDTAHSDAVQLFVERAQRLDKSFQLSAETSADVTAICQLVAGMPLAIELASSWLRSRSLADIASGMTESFDNVATRLRDLRPQHRSLRSVFDYSWRLLAESQQQLLAKLSVFRGGFDEVAALAVADGSRQALAELQAQSLLQRTQAGRYALHEVVRQFSAEKLSSSSVNAHHATHYLQLAANYSDQLFGHMPSQAITALEHDLDNLRVAWRFASDNGQTALQIASADSVNRLLLTLGFSAEAEALFTQATAIIEIRPLLAHILFMRGRSEGAEALAQSVIDASDVSVRSRVLAEIVLGELESERGQASGEQRFRHTLLLAEQHGLIREQVRLLNAFAFAVNVRGEYEAGRALAERGLALARQVDDSLLQHKMLTAMAISMMEVGDFHAGRACVEEGYRLAELTGDQRYLARAANMLGWMARRLGDYETALVQHALSAELASAMGEEIQTTHAWFNLSVAYLLLGDAAKSLEFAEKTAELARRVGSAESEAMGLSMVAKARRLQQRYAEAEAVCERALGIWRQVGHPANSAEMEIVLADLRHRQGKDVRSLVRESAEFVRNNSCNGMINQEAAFATLLDLMGSYSLTNNAAIKQKYADIIQQMQAQKTA